MNVKEFIGSIERAYSLTYGEWMRKLIERYLFGWEEYKLSILFAETLKAHSSTYKSLPDIAIFESVGNKVYAEIEAKEMLSPINPNRLLPGPGERYATQDEINELNQYFASIGIKYKVGENDEKWYYKRGIKAWESHR